MVDLRAWDALEGSSPAVGERDFFSKGFSCGIGMVQSLILGGKSQNNFFLTNKLLGWLLHVAGWHMSNTTQKKLIIQYTRY
jgi:hypothetical protein